MNNSDTNNHADIDVSIDGDVAVVGSKKERDGAVTDGDGDCYGNGGNDNGDGNGDGDGKLIDESSSSGKKRKLNNEGNEVKKSAATEDANQNLDANKTEESSMATTPTGNISIASLASAAQLSTVMGWNGLGSILSLSLLNSTTVNNNTSSSSSSNGAGGRTSSSTFASSGSGGGNANNLPIKEQVLQAANKAVNESPPFVHLSKMDSAPQLKIMNSEYATFTATTTTKNTTTNTDGNIFNDVEARITVNDHLACKQGEGEMRGYRMTRASHGVNSSAGNYYYEVIIQKPPTAKELINSLPSNVRLGPKLQREMQEALLAEEERESTKFRKENEGTTGNNAKIEKLKDNNLNVSLGNNNEQGKVTGFGSHVRLGWSMRTADLQAPVGYDKWSYGVRSIKGSKIHCSLREDNWGGEPFGPGDVVGCGISMVSDGNEKEKEREGSGGETINGRGQQTRGNENHIRFFKNGLPMGEFVISKGKREGGAAFIVPDGVYYPAISLYMGATVKVNFGPNFVYPPRKLPTGLKFRPISKLCQQPISIEETLAKVTKERTFRKADTQQKFLDLVQTETRVLLDAYQNHRKKHVIDVWKERTKRKLKTEDLVNDEFSSPDRDALTRIL